MADPNGNVLVPPPGAIPLLGDVLFNFYNNGTSIIACANVIRNYL